MMARSKPWRNDPAKTYHGDDRNMAALGRSRPRDKAWYAWNGDPKLKRSEGRMELVYGGVEQQGGKYGSQTPVSQDWIAKVVPGLAS